MEHNEAAIQPDHYRVSRGEPGASVVTPLRDGYPSIENPPMVPVSPPTLLPAVAEDQNESKIVAPSRRDKVANYRFTLIITINKEAAKEKGAKVKAIARLLGLYNSGLLLPGVLKELGPISQRTFYRFREILKKKGIEGLVLQYGRNTRKPFGQVTQTEKDFLLGFLHDPNRPNISDAIRECKKYLEENSIAHPSTLRRFINYYKKYYNDVWTIEREGEKAWNDKVAPYQDRDPMSLAVGEVLVADGHRLNANVVDPITGKNKRPTIVLFWDWKSTYPLGLGIGFSENVQCIWEALRNAILTLGKKPSQIYIDNGKAFLAKIFTQKTVIEETEIEIPGIFEKLGIKRRTALKYHAESKPIERFFRILNDRLTRRLQSYTGASIEDKPAYLLPNEPRARALHDDRVPTVSDLFRMFYLWREEYIDEPRPRRRNLTPRQMFEEGKGPGVDPAELYHLMMVGDVKTVRRNRFTFVGTDWTGSCLYGYKGKIIILYALSDLSKIYVFDSNNQFMGAVTQASAADPINDWQAAKRIIAERRTFKRQTKKLANFIREKSLLIDSRCSPNLLEYIEAEEAKKPENKRISPFVNDPESALVLKIEADKIDLAADHGSPLSGPYFREAWERYEWYLKNDSKTYNLADLVWIDWFIDSDFYHQIYEDNASHLELLKSRHPEETEQPLNGNNQEDKNYRNLTGDATIEIHWRRMKNSIIVDPVSGLSRSRDWTALPEQIDIYGWYRGIEQRFRGTLTEVDWEEVKKCEATNKWWKIYYSENKHPHLEKEMINHI